MRIVYAGTPEFAVAPLAALLEAGHTVAAVYTQPDRLAGRGRGLSASPVKALALEAGLPVLQPDTLKGPEAAATLAGLAPQAMVVAAYGLILPPAMLALPALGCLNIHGSLLPRWRGAAPIQRALEAGDAETGVCLMQMEAGLDTGPVYARRSTPIEAADTAATLGARLSALGATLLLEVLEDLGAGRARASAQPGAGVSYAHKLSKAEAGIDWSAPAPLLERRVRAFQPWPVAQTVWRGSPLRVLAARLAPGPAGDLPGRVQKLTPEVIEVATGEGVLGLTRIQLPGRNIMNIKDFMNGSGASLTVGTVFGS